MDEIQALNPLCAACILGLGYDHAFPVGIAALICTSNHSLRKE